MIFHVAGTDEALANPVTVRLLVAALGAVTVAAVVTGGMSVAGVGTPALRRELWLRLGSWVVLLPAMILPVLAGKTWLIAEVTLLGLLCLREYNRATGLFREPLIEFVIVLGVLAVNFAALDHWYGFFVALISITVGLLAVASLPLDRPAGYIQRTALGIVGFMLFGSGLAHLGYMGNDLNYRPLVLLVMLSVALNDVMAFTAGKLIGGPKLLPATSPGKTVSGALGALVVTTAFFAGVSHLIFRGSPIDGPLWLLLLGVLVSVAAQAGDLMLSSIKRDIGIKDMGAVLPGHGGVLDRFNSLLLTSPAVFHFVNYFVGFGREQPVRIITG
ncbi:MAG TPA: phosphatidate cytidylyltransferase [Acidisphaera sp.]|nr:phosphatidate cytidylyltransferase [Acidisphaera sp.]